MSDYISRQEAIDDIDSLYFDTVDDHDRAKERIKRLPSAQPERKNGKWERHYSRPNVYKDLCWHCSECGYKSSDNWADKWNYCPNCGCYNGGNQDEI